VALVVKHWSRVAYEEGGWQSGGTEPGQSAGAVNETLPSFTDTRGLVPNPEPTTVTGVVCPAIQVDGDTQLMLGVGSPTVKFVEVVHPMLVVTTRE